VKNATLTTSQSLQHRAFALTPFVQNALSPIKPARAVASTAVITDTVSTDTVSTGTVSAGTVSTEPTAELSQLVLPQAKPAKSSATADADQASVAMSLAAAVVSNNIDAVRALIKEGADLRPLNWYDRPVLVTAAAQGRIEIVQLLIAARANVNNGYESLPLASAAAQGHLKVVRLLLAAGAHLNAQNSNGYTALIAAAAAGHLDVVRFLVESGARLTATNSGDTALSLAAKKGHQSVYAFLHHKVTPAVAPQPLVVPQLVVKNMSVMDEMIASGAKELNELISNSTPNVEPIADSDSK